MTDADALAHTLNAAVTHHQTGNLTEAERLYRQILEHDPDQSDALNLLGVITAQSGDLDLALGLFDRASTAAPNIATIPYNKANALRDAGRHEDARHAYETALSIDPDYTDARLNLGALLHEGGKPEAAIAHFNILLEQVPDMAQGHYNLGKCRQTQGRMDDAKAALEKAIALNPNDPNAHLTLANVLADMGVYDDAVKHIQVAIKINPNWAEAISTHGLILSRSGSYQDAVEKCSAAIAQQPDNALLHFNLGFVHHKEGRFKDAKQAFSESRAQCHANQNDIMALSNQAVVTLDPWTALEFLEDALTHSRSASALTHIGAAFQLLDLHTMALIFLDEAIQMDPDYNTARGIRGKLKVSTNQFLDGWEDLCYTLDKTGAGLSADDHLPLWRGENLKDKTILVTLQEGIGDQILFSTILPQLSYMDGRCIVECARRLVPILQRTYPNLAVCDWQNSSQRARNRGEADYICPAVNLARWLRRDRTGFAKTTRHLRANSDLTELYRKKYEDAAAGRRIIGLSWLSGSQKNGPSKTIELEDLVSNFDTDSVYLVSLQYGNMETHLDQFRERVGIDIHYDTSVNQLRDLESFFAQVAAMDLVISISSTAAHVSGSQGIPTWLLLPRGSGVLYYWGTEDSNSPWYPSVQIFRQRSTPQFDRPWWPSVVDEAVTALRAWIAKPLDRQTTP